MDEAQQPDIKRSENEEDEAIANRLAAALCEDDVEKFLQLYDEIPTGVSLERVSNSLREYNFNYLRARFPLRGCLNL
jgi:hypothetical protein